MGDCSAVVALDGELTYQKLSSLSNRVATLLRDKGIGEHSIVALQCSRSTYLPVGMLGILKAGAAFLPIDSVLPDERVRYMLGETHATVAISDSEQAQRSLAAEVHRVPESRSA